MENGYSPFVPENLVSKTGSFVLSRVSLLILHTRVESNAMLCYAMVFIGRGISPAFRDGVHIYTVNRHRVTVPSLSSGHANYAHRLRSMQRVRRRRASSSQGSSSNGCCLFRYYHGPILCAVFPTPTIDAVRLKGAIHKVCGGKSI